MHTRQSGAAHVPMIFFLLLMVLFLATLGFAWVTQNKNGELIEARNKAITEAQVEKNRALLVEHYVADLNDSVRMPGAYDGRPDSKSMYGDAKLDQTGVMNPAAIKKALEDAASAAGVPVSLGLEATLGSLVTAVKAANQRAKDAETERDRMATAKSEIESSLRKATSEAATKAREFNQGLDDARSQFEGAKATKESTITNLQGTVRTKDEEKLALQEQKEASEKSLNKEIDKLRNQNAALSAREQLRQPANVADGKIIAARTGVKTAFIDLGKKDLLQPDTMFRIKNPSNDSVKGYAKVIRVEPERAEVELSGIVDPIGDYIREGDLLYNDLYTPGMTRTIYLMGRFSAPYDANTLTTLLRALGNKVVTKMGPGVDTVIVGNDPLNEEGDGFASVQESAEYKLAVDLRVEFAPLLKIRDLVAAR